MVSLNPACGRACLPIEEYEPLIERIVELERLLAQAKDALAVIARMAMNQLPHPR